MATAIATGTTTALIERVATAGRIDREAGVIRGVRILGRVSQNGREYTQGAIREAAALYEGVGVYVDHPPRSAPNTERRIADKIGWLESIKVTDDGLRGDLHLLRSHSLYESICEAAERNPAMLGLSHNAEGKTRRDRGKTLVERIIRVRSVDLVTDPATSVGLFESKGLDMSTEDFAKALLSPASVLREQDEEAMPTTPVADDEDDSDGLQDPAAGVQRGMANALQNSINAVLSDVELDFAGKLDKLTRILDEYKKIARKLPKPVEESRGRGSRTWPGRQHDSLPSSAEDFAKALLR